MISANCVRFRTYWTEFGTTEIYSDISVDRNAPETMYYRKPAIQYSKAGPK